MEYSRIVSFLPSATELIYALGAQDSLYGITHECSFPVDAKSKPRVINSVVDSENLDSKEIDEVTSKLLKDGKEIFTLDEENLKKANPDLIIYQNTCEVCAAHSNQISNALKILEKKPHLQPMDPHNLEEILQTVLDLSAVIGKKAEGQKLKKSLQQRIQILKNKDFETRPKILALEWLDPFFTSGHWIPQMVSIAGGINLVSRTGERSRRLDFEEVSSANPEIIILMPCGFDTTRTISEYENALKSDHRWNSLEAVKKGRVYAVDANSYFSKPSIRTITGLEILAKILHPDLCSDIIIPQNSMQIIK